MTASLYLYVRLFGNFVAVRIFFIPVETSHEMSLIHATGVGVQTVKRQERLELERAVQDLERRLPKASASDLERELERSAPIAYGSWREETPVVRSRLRAVQRWRSGARGRDAGKSPIHLFPYVWPVGDRQRKEVDDEYQISALVASGSWRLFLYNCGPEVIRDVRVFLDRTALDYAPSVLTGRFQEIHWQRIDAIKSECLNIDGPRQSRHPLRVEFVISRGTRHARLEGDLHLDTVQGWIHFEGRDGRGREIE